jgi:hypothetical protein
MMRTIVHPDAFEFSCGYAVGLCFNRLDLSRITFVDESDAYSHPAALDGSLENAIGQNTDHLHGGPRAPAEPSMSAAPCVSPSLETQKHEETAQCVENSEQIIRNPRVLK